MKHCNSNFPIEFKYIKTKKINKVLKLILTEKN